MADYTKITDVSKLADAYGYDMKLHGKSMYWSSPRECPDTTRDLQNSPLYKSLSPEDKEALLNHGHMMKRFGMGCYQERGANVELYDRYVRTDGPPNPFNKPKSTKSNPEEPAGPGMD